MTETRTRRLWVAYGPAGAVGSIRTEDGAYIVTMARADAPVGSYESLDVAKNALFSQLKPGTDWPEFREH
jgi:hypothetical protein